MVVVMELGEERCCDKAGRKAGSQTTSKRLLGDQQEEKRRRVCALYGYEQDSDVVGANVLRRFPLKMAKRDSFRSV